MVRYRQVLSSVTNQQLDNTCLYLTIYLVRQAVLRKYALGGKPPATGYGQHFA